jgi:hypothetical protein
VQWNNIRNVLDAMNDFFGILCTMHINSM